MKYFICLAAIVTGLWLAAGLLPQAWAQSAMDRYVLAPGDQIRINVAGEADLSGTHQIRADGHVTLPLIGAVALAGVTADEAAAQISARLKDGYLRRPQVGVVMEGHRPVYLLGGVKNPGEYAYREGMTVLQAVAMGGGFERSGRDHTAQITRRDAGGETTATFPIDGTVILPGDVLKINSRWRYHE